MYQEETWLNNGNKFDYGIGLQTRSIHVHVFLIVF